MKEWAVILISLAVSAVIATVAVIIFWVVTKNGGTSSSDASTSSSGQPTQSVTLVTTASGPFATAADVIVTLAKRNGIVTASFTALEEAVDTPAPITIDEPMPATFLPLGIGAADWNSAYPVINSSDTVIGFLSVNGGGNMIFRNEGLTDFNGPTAGILQGSVSWIVS